MYDFAYQKPSSLADAVKALQSDADAKALAGGMTLIPVMEAPKPAPATAQTNSATDSALPTLYTCAMHPEVVFDKPGTCPICKMELVPTSTVPDGKIAEEKWRREHAR